MIRWNLSENNMVRSGLTVVAEVGPPEGTVDAGDVGINANDNVSTCCGVDGRGILDEYFQKS